MERLLVFYQMCTSLYPLINICGSGTIHFSKKVRDEKGQVDPIDPIATSTSCTPEAQLRSLLEHNWICYCQFGPK
ncbi:hypothetical protein Taro_005395, partial [Colocasia esculenta]|nr:hypothetical protein [Colocasia esculenta]